jgi:hypothetical protein
VLHPLCAIASSTPGGSTYCRLSCSAAKAQWCTLLTHPAHATTLQHGVEARKKALQAALDDVLRYLSTGEHPTAAELSHTTLMLRGTRNLSYLCWHDLQAYLCWSASRTTAALPAPSQA